MLTTAVVMPYLIVRFGIHERHITFPWRTGPAWSRFEWSYLVGVVALHRLSTLSRRTQRCGHADATAAKPARITSGAVEPLSASCLLP